MRNIVRYTYPRAATLFPVLARRSLRSSRSTKRTV